MKTHSQVFFLHRVTLPNTAPYLTLVESNLDGCDGYKLLGAAKITVDIPEYPLFIKSAAERVEI